jgi:arsenite oxidase small subunit
LVAKNEPLLFLVTQNCSVNPNEDLEIESESGFLAGLSHGLILALDQLICIRVITRSLLRRTAMSTQENSQSSRRNFLKATGIGGVAVVGTGFASGAANAASPSKQGLTILHYPVKAVGKASGMKVNGPVAFQYPDADSPCLAIKLGKRVPDGVGPDGDIVAYSILCTHMGCPVNYDATEQVFKCPCHYSVFDAELQGQMVCGQATENLTRIVLSYDGRSNTVSATGVDGLIYGRASNIL